MTWGRVLTISIGILELEWIQVVVKNDFFIVTTVVLIHTVSYNRNFESISEDF